jgi:hypothetical protein
MSPDLISRYAHVFVDVAQAGYLSEHVHDVRTIAATLGDAHLGERPCDCTDTVCRRRYAPRSQLSRTISSPIRGFRAIDALR